MFIHSQLFLSPPQSSYTTHATHYIVIIRLNPTLDRSAESF